jgi:hypothetical protein
MRPGSPCAPHEQTASGGKPAAAEERITKRIPRTSPADLNRHWFIVVISHPTTGVDHVSDACARPVSANA